MDNEYLRIYLNDHYAGSVVGIELAKRARDHNEGTELGDALAGIVERIERSRNDLREVMQELSVTPDPVKQAIGWVGEKLARLKMNGQITGYSPASRLIELEGLTLGVSGQVKLWRALDEAKVRVMSVDLLELIARAEGMQEELEGWRLEAARTAIGDSVPEPEPARA